MRGDPEGTSGFGTPTNGFTAAKEDTSYHIGTAASKIKRNKAKKKNCAKGPRYPWVCRKSQSEAQAAQQHCSKVVVPHTLPLRMVNGQTSEWANRSTQAIKQPKRMTGQRAYRSIFQPLGATFDWSEGRHTDRPLSCSSTGLFVVRHFSCSDDTPNMHPIRSAVLGFKATKLDLSHARGSCMKVSISDYSGSLGQFNRSLLFRAPGISCSVVPKECIAVLSVVQLMHFNITGEFCTRPTKENKKKPSSLHLEPPTNT